MTLLRWVLGLMAIAVMLIGGMLAIARRADPVPHVIVTTYEGMGMAAYMVEVDDGTVRRLNGLDLLDIRLMSVSPDGKWLIYAAGGRAYRTTLWGTRARQIKFPKVDIQVASYGYHQWSGDGKWLVVETIDLDMMSTYPLQHLYRINMDTLRPEQLTQHLPFKPHYVETFFFSTPDHDSVVYFGTSEDIENPEIDLYRVEIASGREYKLTDLRDLEYIEGWSEDWLIYWSPIYATLYRVRLDGTKDQQLLLEMNNDWLVHEPIGGWLYFVSHRDEVDGGELYRLRWGGTELQRLTTMEGYEHFVAITPDAMWIYFVNGGTLYQMRADGTELQVVAEGVEFGQALGWSDDGKAFYFHEGVFSITTTLDRLVPVTATIESIGEVNPMTMQFSPDHRWLVYKRVDTGEHGITLMETATGNEKRVRLPLASFQIFGWLPIVEQEWQPELAIVGGLTGSVGSVGLGRLRKR